MRPQLFLLLPWLALFTGCAGIPAAPTPGEWTAPPAPDYAVTSNWAALPDRPGEEADRTPGTQLEDRQATAPADVFYVHPTIYADTRKGNNQWNASLADAKLNEQVDASAMRNHATIFNGATRVYAPRYRQAHLRVFYPRGKAAYRPALDLAYADVLAAFDYYLAHYNRGRPIVIAGHSQGTLHAKRLLADRFDGQPLRERLVAAYLVGMPVSKEQYRTIPVCEAPAQTGCFVSWRTYREDFTPKSDYRDTVRNIAVVNPLTWTTEADLRAPASLNRGGVLYDFGAEPQEEMVWAEIRGAGLFTSKPKFFWSFLFTRKNYHIGDYNLFWMNVRENVGERVRAYVK